MLHVIVVCKTKITTEVTTLVYEVISTKFILPLSLIKIIFKRIKQ